MPGWAKIAIALISTDFLYLWPTKMSIFDDDDDTLKIFSWNGTNECLEVAVTIAERFAVTLRFKNYSIIIFITIMSIKIQPI